MKKEDIEDKTYDVRLMCRSCEHDWIKNVEKGVYVRYEKDNNYMIKAGDDYKNRMYFKCPKCGTNKKIARLPLV